MDLQSIFSPFRDVRYFQFSLPSRGFASIDIVNGPARRYAWRDECEAGGGVWAKGRETWNNEIILVKDRQWLSKS